jgi:hypothetical protein
VSEKGHPYRGLAMTGIVTLFKTPAKFGIRKEKTEIQGTHPSYPLHFTAKDVI